VIRKLLVVGLLVAGNCAAFPGLTLIADHPAAATTPGLIQLFASATVEYARLDFEGERGEEVEKRKVCIISFNKQ
jgi:hypothetical protein